MPWWIIFCLEKFREIWVRGSILFLFHQLIPLLTVSWLGLLSIHCRFRHVEANLLGPMPTRAYLVKGQLEDTTWGCRMTGLVWLGHTWNAVQWPERMIESLALHQIGHSLRLLFIIGILSCFFFGSIFAHLLERCKSAFTMHSTSCLLPTQKRGGKKHNSQLKCLSCTQEHISGGRLRLLGHDEVLRMP